MHLVLIAWLYVIGMMAFTASTLWRGVLLFVIAGVAPVAAFIAFFGRRAMGRRRAARVARGEASGLEERVHRGDDGDA